MGAEKLKSTVTGVEMFRKILDRGEAGDNVGILLRGIEKTDIKRGMVICKPGSVTPHAKFKAEVYVLKKEEGGRHTPFHNNYRPQFYVRTTDVTGTINLPSGVEMVMPGDNLTITVDLIQAIALNVGVINPNTGFICNKQIIGCHLHEPPMNLGIAIKHSCNPYFYQVYKRLILRGSDPSVFKDSRLGLNSWRNSVEKFGIGKQLQTDIPGVKKGLLPSVEFYDKWYGKGPQCFQKSRFQG